MKRRNFLAATSGLAAYAAVRPSFAATPCPPGQLGVQGGATAQSSCPASSGASDLATLATSMAPGSWAQLNPSNQNAVLGDEPDQGH